MWHSSDTVETGEPPSLALGEHANGQVPGKARRVLSELIRPRKEIRSTFVYLGTQSDADRDASVPCVAVFPAHAIAASTSSNLKLFTSV